MNLEKIEVDGGKDNASKEAKASLENYAQNLYTKTDLAMSIFCNNKSNTK